MAEPNKVIPRPEPDIIVKGLGMLFGNEPKQKGGMPPPVANTREFTPRATPGMLGEGAAANAATELQQRKNRTDAAVKAAGAD